MTNSAKKPAKAKASRDNLDLDLDARLDQATSTLSLDDEPPAGDALDQVLARAKKEIDANLPKELPSATEEITTLPSDDRIDAVDDLDDLLDIDENQLEDIQPIKSEAMTSLENQLAAAMDSSVVSDEDLDNLLGGAGFDFDSLLGDANDELTLSEAEINEDSLMTAVDELLNIGVFDEGIAEPEIVIDEVVEIAEPEIVIDEVVEAAEPEIVIDEIVETVEPELESVVESDMTVDKLDDLDDSKDIELTVEPEAALDDLVDSVPFEDTLSVDSEIEDFQEEFNNFDDVADIDAPLVEMSASIESFNDDLDEMQQLEGLNDAMENKNDTTAGFDLLDDDAIAKEVATPVTESVDDDDWMKQLDGLDEQETEAAAPVDLAKADDDDDWMKQLDGLDEQETEAAAPVDLAKADDDDDWMKQLDGLDEKPANPDSDSEWTSKFSNLDDHDEDTTKMLMDANHDTEEDSIVDGKFNITDANATKQNISPVNPIDEEALLAKVTGQVKDELKGEQDHALSQLRADQDSIDSKNRKQFADAENKRKKTAMFGYIALGAGVIGLIGSAGIGWMSYGTKNDTTNLNQSVTALEEKVNTFLAKNPEKEKEIENIKTSVEQLNQKVDKLAAAQVVVPAVTTAPAADATKTTSMPTPAKPADVTKPNSAVNLLNSKTPAPAPAKASTSPVIDAPKISEADITPPIADIAPVSPAGDSTLKAVEPVKLADMAKKSGEASKEKIVQDIAKEKIQDGAKEKAAKLAKDEAAKAAVKAEAELLTQKIAKATAVAKAAAATTTNSKAEEQRKLLTQSKATEHYIGRTTRGMAHGGRDNSVVDTAKNKVGLKTPVTKEIVNTAVKPQKPVPAGKYSVNVISYQQEWFAQSKAAEFKQKGIPVEVAPVDINNYATRYRLKVPGFKSKAEANAYAAKMKKSFNLNETWVSE